MIGDSVPHKDLIRPKTLELGQPYLLVSDDGTTPVVVSLVNYDPCPAFVIVRLPSGKKVRCARDRVIISE